MTTIVQSQLVAEYPNLQKDLKKIGFSAYETTVYLSLYDMNKPVSASDVEARCISLFNKKIPNTKIYSTLRTLESKGLIEKKQDGTLSYQIIFGEKPLTTYVDRLFEEKQKMVELKRGSTDKALQDVLGKLSPHTQEKDEIWRLYSTSEAGRISADICKRAKDEIILMTEYGGWIHKNSEFISTLEEKSRKGVKIWALISDKEYVNRRRQKERDDFEDFLGNINARVYCYQPKALRMTIVDRKESLFIMFKKPSEEEDPIIYYTALPDISESLAEYFTMKCLSNYRKELSHLLKENKENEGLYNLRNLLLK
jgi:sugar-specific transcriptional regulator TrmB